MMIKAKWGSSWEIAISKNPRFYFMEKSGWGKFVRDNALGHNEFITFTHKGNMHFTVNIFKQDGKEMMQPPQSADPEATSRVKAEQDEDDKKEEVVVVVSSELSSRGVTTAAAGSNGGVTSQRKPKLGKKKADERSKNSSMRAEKDSASASSSSLAEFTIFIKKSYLNFLAIRRSFAKDHMPKEKQKVKIHHPDGKRTWKVTYLARKIGGDVFSGGWGHLVREYPIAVGDSCKFTLTKPDELLLVVSKPEEETH